MSTKQNLKIVFVIRSPDQFHYFSSIIKTLCARRNSVSVFFDERYAKRAGIDRVEELRSEFDNFSYEFVEARTDCWQRLLFPLRELWSYFRFLVIPDQSDAWRKLQLTYISLRIRPYVADKSSFLNRLFGRPVFLKFFRFIENTIPPDKKIVARLQDEQPDVVITSPANYRFSTADIEYLKAAKALKIPTVVPVISWDNLTVRGPLFIIPDRLLAWNQAHAEEAVKWHGVPKKNIRIIGSSFFDGWFTPPLKSAKNTRNSQLYTDNTDRQQTLTAESEKREAQQISTAGFTKFSPSVSREEFAKKAGLISEKPYILWLGSSKNIAPDETLLIQEAKKAFENSPDKKMKEMQIVVRPHPAHTKQYEYLGREGMAIFPREGAQMFDEGARQTFYDTLYYAVAAVNINTSGIIDAILAGKPAIAYLDEKYRQSQEETKHFRHLTEYNALSFVCSPEECVEEVKKIMEGRDEHKDARDAFIKDFIRPRGLEVSAGEVAAWEIEELARQNFASRNSRGLTVATNNK